MLLLNTGLGALQEHRSEQALARLRTLSAPQSWVWRDGCLVRCASRDLVPGDLVRVEAGERIPADGVLVEAHGLMVDESILTGESVPEDKVAGGEALSGTLVVRGHGLLELTRTGPTSAMGRLATMIGELALEQTPLERRLGRLGQQTLFGSSVEFQFGDRTLGGSGQNANVWAPDLSTSRQDRERTEKDRADRPGLY